MINRKPVNEGRNWFRQGGSTGKAPKKRIRGRGRNHIYRPPGAARSRKIASKRKFKPGGAICPTGQTMIDGQCMDTLGRSRTKNYGHTATRPGYGPQVIGIRRGGKISGNGNRRGRKISKTFGQRTRHMRRR